MAAQVVLRYHREFRVPLAEAFAWLTDYRDDDPALAGGAVIVRRPVVERQPGRVVLDGTIRVLGRTSRSRAVVDLHPPDRWESRIVEGSGRGSVYEYRLVPTARGCRLEVAYRLRVRTLRAWLALRLLRGRVLRELDRMWDGFGRAMDEDVARAAGWDLEAPTGEGATGPRRGATRDRREASRTAGR